MTCPDTSQKSPIHRCGARTIPEGRQPDFVADVVVVGFGGAGAAAALEASHAGADVLIVEKLSRGGGNTAISGGGFVIPLDVQQACEYLARTYDFAGDERDDALLQAFAEGSARLASFMRGLDPDAKLAVWGYANFPELPHADTITKYVLRGSHTGGQNLFSLLEKRVASSPRIRVLVQTPAVDLAVAGRSVRGIYARQAGRELLIRARRGVILACGGYENDPELLGTFCQGTQIRSLGCPGNAGDGLRMAQALGAALWHMTSYSCPLGMQVPGCSALVPFAPMTPGYIWVDRHGRRFCNEAGIDLHSCLYAVNRFDPAERCYPAIPCWAIFDEEGRLAGPLAHDRFGYAAVAEGYRWSRDCSREIASGAVLQAATLAELAERIGVPGQALCETVDQWNRDIRNGQDSLFGRRLEKPLREKDTMVGLSARRLSAPIEKGPFCAVRLVPALLNTQGGPRHDAQARVLDTKGHPIEGLYVAGELGSMWGTVYQGSCNVTEAIVFGRIAGRSAAAHTWPQ